MIIFLSIDFLVDLSNNKMHKKIFNSNIFIINT